ncbi:HAD family hydrolase [Nanoarchaeota archaeon]
MIKAVIFDVDGVIVDSEPIHWKTFNIDLKPYDVKIPKKRWMKEFVGTGSLHIMKTIVKENNLIERFNVDIDKMVKHRKFAFQKYLKDHKIKTIPGFKSFKNKLKKTGVKMIIASGGHRNNVMASLKASGVDHEFKDIITGDEAKKRKPNPDIYLQAAKLIKLKPKECMAIEDSPAGVTAAKKAGMFTIGLLTTSSKKQINHADFIIEDFMDKKAKKLLRMIKPQQS